MTTFLKYLCQFTKFYVILTCSNLGKSSSAKKTPIPGGLFTESNSAHIQILNGQPDLISFIDNSSTVNLVLFYASWCGHCQRYAAEFKKFAENVKHWKNLFRVGVIDCGDKTFLKNRVSNFEACFKANVNHYPTILVYNAYHKIPDFIKNTKIQKIPSDFSNFDRNGSYDDHSLRKWVIQDIFTENSTEAQTSPWQTSWNTRYNKGKFCPLQPEIRTSFLSSLEVFATKRTWGKDCTIFIYSENEVLAKSVILAVGGYFRGFSAFHVRSVREVVVFEGRKVVVISLKKAENERNLTADVIERVFSELKRSFPEKAELRDANFGEHEFRGENDENLENDENRVNDENRENDENPKNSVSSKFVPENTELSSKNQINDHLNVASSMIKFEIPQNLNDSNSAHAYDMLTLLYRKHQNKKTETTTALTNFYKCIQF